MKIKVTTRHESTLKDLTPDQIHELEMHSFINVLNVISLQLQILADEEPARSQLEGAITRTKELSGKAIEGQQEVFFPENIQQYQKGIRTCITSLKNAAKDDTDYLETLQKAADLLEEIFTVMDLRSDELYQRFTHPGRWLFYPVEQFKTEFNAFLYTIEKNSRGRFRILRNIALQEESDYLLNFEVDSELDGQIGMPLLFKDVVRDLISNARKYTPPGGHIYIGLYQRKDRLRFMVKDTGIGIPSEELHRVLEHGYRASNAEHIRTMGGGFGLTKALYVVRQLKGEMWIESETGQGTTITIDIPLPDDILDS